MRARTDDRPHRLQLHKTPRRPDRTGAGQAKIAAFDVQQNPDSPGLPLRRLNRARDPDFWSARVTRDLRITLQKRGGDTLLASVGHRDAAAA